MRWILNCGPFIKKLNDDALILQQKELNVYSSDENATVWRSRRRPFGPAVPAENWEHGQWLLPSLPASWHSSLHIGTTNFLHKRTVCSAVHCTAGLWDNGSEYFVWNTVWQLPSDIGLYAVGCWNRSSIVFSHIFQKWMKVSLLFHFFPLPLLHYPLFPPLFFLSSPLLSSTPPILPSSLLNFENLELRRSYHSTYPTPTRLPLRLSWHSIDFEFRESIFFFFFSPPLPHPLSHHSDVIN